MRMDFAVVFARVARTLASPGHKRRKRTIRDGPGST
jgi:hypothetical protein